MLVEDLKRKENFTELEKVLADYILANHQKALGMTLTEISSEAYVSSPTVVRLCKKLGFNSFVDFKIRLSKEATEEYSQMTQVNYNFPFAHNDSPQDLVEKMASLALAGIINCRDHYDVAAAQRVARLLTSRRIIDVYGIGQTLWATQNFCEKMVRIGYITTTIEPYDSQLYRARASRDDRVAFLVSYSGTQPILMDVAPILKRNNTPIVVVTGNRNSPLLTYATLKLFVESQENLHIAEKMDYFSALYMMHYLFDCLYAIAFNLNYDENMERTKENANTDFVFPQKKESVGQTARKKA